MPEVLARQLAELESANPAELRIRWERAHKHPAPKRGAITKIMTSDGGKGDTVPLTVERLYIFHEVGRHLGNVG